MRPETCPIVCWWLIGLMWIHEKQHASNGKKRHTASDEHKGFRLAGCRRKSAYTQHKRKIIGSSGQMPLLLFVSVSHCSRTGIHKTMRASCPSNAHTHISGQSTCTCTAYLLRVDRILYFSNAVLSYSVRTVAWNNNSHGAYSFCIPDAYSPSDQKLLVL